ncbi:dienelactone hydrolase endo-1-3,1,4-beta-D-glucanase [Cyathus striatus]|nr:dienelactone hydrolase endo-1-3,1,4-beta-D-glucanase [Cyathus striatus]
MSCPDCIKGNILPGDPVGTMQVDGSYLASGPGTSDKAVVLLTDAFGLAIKNPKIIADEFAKQLECDVWVPDMFDGQPPMRVDQLKLPDSPGVKKTLWDRLQFIFAVLVCLPRLIRSRPAVVQTRTETFLAKIKSEKGYKKIGAVGYCYGGLTCVRVGAEKPELLDAVVIAHPGPFSLDLLKTIPVPSSWACAEEDESFSDEKRLQAEAILAGRTGENAIPYEFKYYKGTVHGFATRPNLSLPDVKAGYEGAFNQTIEWFRKYLV